MEKQHILDEIQRTAKENNRAPLGIARFFKETGIKVADWHGKHWIRWGDALREAGFAPNPMNPAREDEELIQSMIALIRELGRYPVKGEIRMKCRRDPSFPSDKTFERYGGKPQQAAKVLEYCEARDGFADVVALCGPVAEAKAAKTNDAPTLPSEIGFVYLLKAGRNFKIGKSNAVGRREREIALQLPDKANTVHVIKTDDPNGIEGYWHRRFAEKRKNGEWFALDAADVSAFRRRKFM